MCPRQAPISIEAGREEVLADDLRRQIKAGLSNDVGIPLEFDPARAVEAVV